MQCLKILALIGLHGLLVHEVKAASLWPAGEGVCLGTWSYQEALTCKVSTGELKYNDTPRYPMKNQSCDSWVFGENIVSSETLTVEISYRTGVDNAQDAADWCAGQNRILETVNGQSAWQSGVGFLPERVLKQKKGRNLRIDGNIATCDVETITPKHGTGPACGTIQDTENPIYDVIGEETELKADISCGVTEKSLPRGANQADYMNLPTVVPSSFVCSTGDNLPVTTASEVQVKATLLNKQLLAALRLDSSECAYKQNLAQYALDLIAEHGAQLAGSQSRLLSLVASNVTKSCQ